MNKKTAVVTGATSGLGQAAALALAKQGWHVVLVGRDGARAQETLVAMDAAGGGEVALADLFSLRDVVALGRRLAAEHPRIDLLLNNAGGSFARTERTIDGLERTVALNVAAPFALLEQLMPSLARAQGRVVNVATGVQASATATIAQLSDATASAGMGQYVRAKLAALALVSEGAARYGDRGVQFVGLHPGIILDTRFGAENPAFVRWLAPKIARLFRLDSTLEEAAARYLAVSTEPVVQAGFYYEGKLRPLPRQAADPQFRRELWSWLSSLPALATSTPVAQASA